MGFFKSANDQEVQEYKDAFRRAEKELNAYKKYVSEQEDKWDRSAARNDEQHTYDMDILIRNHKDEVARINHNKDVEIEKATSKERAEVTRLTIENGGLRKENEVLTTAFKNLGFDVKDMKDILESLVKGIVSKNEVKVIK